MAEGIGEPAERDRRRRNMSDRAEEGVARSPQIPCSNGIYHGMIPFMKSKVTLDNAGRVVIPKTLRDELGLEPGDTLALESDGERVTLRPVRSDAPLRKEQGVWVFRSGRAIAASETGRVLQDLRAERVRTAARRSAL